MLIKRVSPVTKKNNVMDIDITLSQYVSWERGGILIQNAMPNISLDEREFIISGCMPDDFDSLFGEYDEQ
tara:strand:- start:12428 stop:12637 length:210 start_codon:yes stop_codon:yes gene_type:complete